MYVIYYLIDSRDIVTASVVHFIGHSQQMWVKESEMCRICTFSVVYLATCRLFTYGMRVALLGKMTCFISCLHKYNLFLNSLSS